MYKVMLVDDDYPVLELLSEAIDWERLGLEIVGLHGNGAAALEAAEADMPDILITDIGMPQMDGLELVRRLKEKKPHLLVAILTCHSEFAYAKRAIELQVQDYIVMDTLVPGDLLPVLERFVGNLNEERELNLERHRLLHMVDQSREAMREQWVHRALERPMLQPESWSRELQSFGLPVEDRVLLPALGFLGDLQTARRRFSSDDILKFAVTNVTDEVLQQEGAEAVWFPYSSRLWFSLHSFRRTLSVNGYEETRQLLRKVQDALQRALKLTMSFQLGELGSSFGELKQSMARLLDAGSQRFYMEQGEIAAVRAVPAQEQDLFAHYMEAIDAFRDRVMKGDVSGVKDKVEEWTDFLLAKKFEPEAVKDWALKLLLDIRLKRQSARHFRSFRSAESLHKDAAELGSLFELRRWLTEQLLAAADPAGETGIRTHRKEVLDACDYVASHLDRRISLEEVAEHLHLNASYFSRLFKKETGETFIEYVNRVKIERAKELLEQTSHPVSKICEMLGYDNQSYFIKLFKGHTGMNPLDYRTHGA